MHPMLASVYIAFSQHRPLTLSPDAVWLTIIQGIGQHMAIHSEMLRRTFVSHDRKLDLVFEGDGWIKGTPENPWPEAFDSWTNQIREHVGVSVYDALVCDFETSTKTDIAASQVIMMDAFKKYFRYAAIGVCGIPEVTLTGEVKDWVHLEKKIEGLEPFQMEWWMKHIRPICNQFTEARRGNVDLGHWQSICKLQSAYGGHIINGWVAKMFPYVRGRASIECNVKSPVFENGEGIFAQSIGAGLSKVPFIFKDARRDNSWPMEAFGGLIGVQQDPETFGLEPISGWAIRDASEFEIALHDLVSRHEFVVKKINKTVNLSEGEKPVEETYAFKSLPIDYAKFHSDYEFANINFGNSISMKLLRFDPENKCLWGEIESLSEDEICILDKDWYRIGKLTDGRELTMHTGFSACEAKVKFKLDNARKLRPVLAPICLSTPESRRLAKGNPVIAISLTDLLQKISIDDSTPYWEQPSFEPICEATDLVEEFRTP
jgi:hypothetical protein